jgi:hypothetical protein
LQVVAQEVPPEQPLPEHLSTIQPQEKAEFQYATHVQEISSPKRLISSITTNITSLLNASLLDNL